MFFCPKCSSLMKPKSEKGKKFLACSCGYTDKKSTDNVVKEVVKKKRDTFDVVTEDDETLPTTEVECTKCKHNQAYWWTKQTRASDEPETKFLKCTKCKHTWRDAS
ncbi:MAG: transcription factor S [Candidatus Woesearchaeota archaeon]|nr:transcription factor S [Candidatus Woesearchaeota archaeon]